MSQEIRHCLDLSLQKLSVGLPRDMSRKWAREESTRATHRRTCKCSEGGTEDLWKGSQDIQPVLCAGANLGSSRHEFSVLTAVPWQKKKKKKKELRNELLKKFSQTRMDDKGFSSYIWKHVLAKLST